MASYNLKNVPMFPRKHKSLTPNDSTVFDYPMAILVMNTGNVAVADEDGTVLVYTAVPAWTILPVTCSKLMNTSTTATGFIGLYGEGDSG